MEIWSFVKDLIIAPVCIWMAWVTKSVYDMKKEQAVVKVQYENLKEDLREIKDILYDLQYREYQRRPSHSKNSTPKDLTSE